MTRTNRETTKRDPKERLKADFGDFAQNLDRLSTRPAAAASII